MGVVPLEFLPGQDPTTLGLTGEEAFTTRGLPAFVANLPADRLLAVEYLRPDGSSGALHLRVRIDTRQEADYYQNGGILPYVLRGLLAA
jgi:aconitate hydratase